MPLKTFFNLSGERQKQILNVCFKEFALKDYESASLSGIVSELKIAKGSFYRYFENKKDLYVYLIDFARDINVCHMDEYFKDTKLDFFDAYMEYFLSILDKEKDYPFYLRFSFRASMEIGVKIVGEENLKRWNENKKHLLDQIIKEHQKRGSLRDDVSVETISSFIRYTSYAFRALIYENYKSDPKNTTGGFDKEALRKEITLNMDLIRRGIRKQTD